MSLILCIETSTSNCSVALIEGGSLSALKEQSGANTHAENIAPFIRDVLSESGKELSLLDAVAVSKGPGSYTGLRIGVSTAKGLCHALGIPLIGIETLYSMTTPLIRGGKYSGEEYLFCPMIDARRMEVYAAVYDQEGKTVRETGADIVDASTYEDYLKSGKVVFFGTGAGKCKEVLGAFENAAFDDKVFPSASDMAFPAIRAFEKEDFEDVAYFEPYYLKDFIATTPKKLL